MNIKPMQIMSFRGKLTKTVSTSSITTEQEDDKMLSQINSQLKNSSKQDLMYWDADSKKISIFDLQNKNEIAFLTNGILINSTQNGNETTKHSVELTDKNKEMFKEILNSMDKVEGIYTFNARKNLRLLDNPFLYD